MCPAHGTIRGIQRRQDTKPDRDIKRVALNRQTAARTLTLLVIHRGQIARPESAAGGRGGCHQGTGIQREHPPLRDNRIGGNPQLAAVACTDLRAPGQLRGAAQRGMGHPVFGRADALGPTGIVAGRTQRNRLAGVDGRSVINRCRRISVLQHGAHILTLTCQIGVLFAAGRDHQDPAEQDSRQPPRRNTQLVDHGPAHFSLSHLMPFYQQWSVVTLGRVAIAGHITVRQFRLAP